MSRAVHPLDHIPGVKSIESLDSSAVKPHRRGVPNSQPAKLTCVAAKSLLWRVLCSFLPTFIIFSLSLICGALTGTLIFLLLQSQNTSTLQSQFDDQTSEISNLFSNQMQMTLSGLKGLQAFFYGSSFVDPYEFRDFVTISSINKNSMLHSFIFAQSVRESENDDFLSKMREYSGYDQFHITERDEVAILRNVTAPRDGYTFMHPVTCIESGALQMNGDALAREFPLGLDLARTMSMECVSALNITTSTGKAQTCAAEFQSGSGSGESSQYMVLFLPAISTETQRGVLIVHLDLNQALMGVSSRVQREYLQVIVHVGNAVGMVGVSGTEKPLYQKVVVTELDSFAPVLEYKLSPEAESYLLPNRWAMYVQLVVCIVGFCMIGLLIIAVLKFVKASISAIRSAKKKTRELKSAREVAEALSLLRLQDESVNQLCSKENPTQLETILKKIVVNMKEYVKFLPASLLTSLNDDETEHDADSASEDSSQPRSHNSKSRYSKDSRSLRSSNQRLRNNLSTGLKRKFITLLTLDISDTHEILADCADTSRFVEIHADYVDSMIETVKSFGGDCIGIHADQLLFSWNAVAYRLNAETRACEAACKCVHIFNQSMKLRFKEEGFQGVKLKISVVSGDATVGNVGNLHKSFAHFTPIYKRGLYLCKLNKRLGTDILVDDMTLAKTDMRIDACFIDKLSFQNVNGNEEQKCIVHVLSTQCTLQQGDEWLYEIKDKLNQHDTDHENSKVLRDSWSHLFNGDMIEASKSLTQLKVDVLLPHEEISMRRLKNLLQNASADPDDVGYCRDVPYVHGAMN